MARRLLSWLPIAMTLVMGISVLDCGLAAPAASTPGDRPSPRFQALECPAPGQGITWAILEWNGSHHRVPPYLSSLGQSESGTGVICSPPFVVASDTITLTLCGYDGSHGGGENYVALVDVRKGKVLMKTPAPNSETMQTRRWDVHRLRGKQVRIEVHDGSAGQGFAWLGVGSIDASPALTVDFRQGLPDRWQAEEAATPARYEVVTGGIPFRRNANCFTLVPKSGAVEIHCQLTARRLFLLGCTVAGGKALETYGGLEIHYRNGSPDVIPLMCGFTLDAAYKQRSPSAALHLHASSDPYQLYLVVRPRDEVIEKIRLVANPQSGPGPLPRITAITCETDAQSEHLVRLPDSRPDAAEARWIETHTVSASSPPLGHIMQQIRRDHHLPVATSPVHFRKQQLDKVFRSEGVAVADFNDDGQLDIAAGNVYYAGPDWTLVPMRGEPREFNRYGYSDAFLCFAEDVDHDGATDLIVVGFPGQKTHWWRNPGKAGGEWTEHLILAQTGNESPVYLDIDGDGQRELVCVNDRRIALVRPGPDPTRPWTIRHISNTGQPAPGHGLGVGDINLDGHLNIVMPEGWWQGPAKPTAEAWTLHAAELFGGAQLCVADLDGDGDQDVLGSSPHGYGICWSEQTGDGWQAHEINRRDSQTHALALADIDGDGLVDFVTGKRFWAHNGHDPGSYEPAVLCWYQQQRTNGRLTWIRHVIDVDSGVGLQVHIVDLNHDGRLDVVTSNKKGVFCFLQH